MISFDKIRAKATQIIKGWRYILSLFLIKHILELKSENNIGKVPCRLEKKLDEARRKKKQKQTNINKKKKKN